MSLSWKKLMFWEGKPLAPGCLGKQHGLQQGLRQYPANDRCPSETSSIPVKSMMEYSTSIPGSFLLDHSLPPKLDVNVGATSHFFQPPRTPSASTSLHRSSISISSGFRNESTNKGCKRGRDDSFKSSATVTPMAVVERSLSTSVRPAAPSTPGTLSPAPLVNTRYQLAGGLDTPTPTQDSYTLSPDLTARNGGRWQSSSNFSPDSSLQIPRERNGQARLPAASPNTLRRIIHGFFGIAGQTWDFCSRTAFRGFFSGGGKGYHVPSPSDNTLHEMQSSWQQVQENRLLAREAEETKSSLPGGFPDEDFIPDYFSRTPQQPPSPSRPAKRIKQGRDNSELRANWVIVGGGEQSSREGSPSRIAARNLPQKGSPSRLPQPASNLGVPPRQLHHPPRPSLASYASSPFSINHNHPNQQRPKPSHRHSASIASTRSPANHRPFAPITPKSKRPSTSAGAPDRTMTSPPLISAEVQRHALKLQKRKKEEDASLKRWNAQLTAMIREGKEALGTRFEVHDEEDEEMNMDMDMDGAELTDEGYGEGEVVMEEERRSRGGFVGKR